MKRIFVLTLILLTLCLAACNANWHWPWESSEDSTLGAYTYVATFSDSQTYTADVVSAHVTYPGQSTWDKGWFDVDPNPATRGGILSWSAEYAPDTDVGIDLQNENAPLSAIKFTINSTGYSRTMGGITTTFNGQVWTKTPGYDNRWEITLDCR